MRDINIVIGVLALIVILALAGFTGPYNSLLSQSRATDGQWEQFDFSPTFLGQGCGTPPVSAPL